MPPHGLPALSSDPVLYLPLWLGTMRDHSGHGNHGTPNNMRWSQHGCIDGALPSVSTGRIDIADSPSIRLSSFTIFASGMAGFSQLAADQVMVIQGANAYYWRLRSTAMRLTVGGVSSDLVTTYDGSRSVAVTLSSGNKPDFYHGGSHAGAGTVALTGTTAGANALVMSRGASAMQNQADTFLLYPTALSAPEIQTLHDWSQSRFTPRKQWPGMGLRYPNRGTPYTPATGDPMFLDNIQTARVTLANETSGKLSNTDYTIQSGTWAVNEDSTTGERYICGGSAGCEAFRPNSTAYGTWDVCFARPNGLTTSIVGLVSSERSWNMAGNNGYILRHRQAAGQLVLIRVTNGSAAAFVGSAVAGIDAGPAYSFRITRSAGNDWIVYIRGGEWQNWTQVISGNDATHTTSNYLQMEMNDNETVYFDRQYSGVVSPI